MAICDLYLISLSPGTTIPQFLALTKRHNLPILSQARVLRWVVLPSQLSTVPLLAHNIHWDLLLVLAPQSDSYSLPQEISSTHISASWRVAAGVPSALMKSYTGTNASLLKPFQQSSPAAPEASPSSSGQSLQLTSELSNYINDPPKSLPFSVAPSHPISMLNLLSFNPGKKQDYIKYGQEFSARVGSKFGGKVKLVGHVLGVDGKTGEKEGWDEIAYVHYPTLGHFASMLADGNYQEVNQQYRVGALRDTFILCCVEVDGEGSPAAAGNGAGEGKAAKL